jgi:hypothetical protein
MLFGGVKSMCWKAKQYQLAARHVLVQLDSKTLVQPAEQVADLGFDIRLISLILAGLIGPG